MTACVPAMATLCVPLALEHDFSIPPGAGKYTMLLEQYREAIGKLRLPLPPGVAWRWLDHGRGDVRQLHARRFVVAGDNDALVRLDFDDGIGVVVLAVAFDHGLEGVVGNAVNPAVF